MSAEIIVVVGMNREARVARLLGSVVIGIDRLAAALERGASGVLSFGLCGGLAPALVPGDLIVGSRVRAGPREHAVDAKWLARLTRLLPAATVGGVAGCDGIVATAEDKARLGQETGAIAADMESHRAAELAFAAGVPFAVVRAVSDGATQSLPLCAQRGFRADGGVDIAAVVFGLLARPSEFPALMRTADGAGKAMAALADAARRLTGKL